MVAFSSCDNENKNLLRTIEGRWEVESVSFSKATGKPDSTATPSSVYWIFEDCNDKKNGNVAENCALTYYENNEKIAFTYFVKAQGGGPKEIDIRAKTLPNNDQNFQRIAPFLMKSYTLNQQTDQSLVLSCTDCDKSLGGQIDYRSTEWHLKR